MEANTRNYGNTKEMGHSASEGVGCGARGGWEEAETGKVDFNEVEQGNMAFRAEGRAGGPGVGKTLACLWVCELSLQETLGASGWETCRAARSFWPTCPLKGCGSHLKKYSRTDVVRSSRMLPMVAIRQEHGGESVGGKESS